MGEKNKYDVIRTLNYDGVPYGPSHKNRVVEMDSENAAQLVTRGILAPVVIETETGSTSAPAAAEDRPAAAKTEDAPGKKSGKRKK